MKSLVFVDDDGPVLVLCAGDRRVDTAALGVRRATPDEVREATGFAIGGVPPLGHPAAAHAGRRLAAAVRDGVVRGRDAERGVRGGHRRLIAALPAGEERELTEPA